MHTGMILVTGPTGSGKTTTRYTLMDIINTPDVNISTIEDPIEYQMPRINQTQVKPEIGLTFAAGLRALLRQDPDIIMVGEIRDLETADIAIKAAQTGHLVLSTLHTNDAPRTLTRLMNMGVAPFNIASSVLLITAQRLAGGVVGKKVGEGFYRYENGAPQVAPEPAAPLIAEMPPVWVSPRASRRAELLQLLKDLDARIETGSSPSPAALTVVAPLGFDVTTVAVVERLDPARTVGIDLLIDDAATKRRVLATNPATRVDMRDAAHALFARDGKAVSVIRDSGGFVTQRVVSTIVNIASDICQQRICSPQDLETAVTLGLGYPLGPLAMGDRYGPTNILEVLFNMQTVYGDPRYRPSPWLRRRGAIGLSLLHTEE
jgi:energy-coupling factor transporter ATP-binding protein EcfA2